MYYSPLNLGLFQLLKIILNCLKFSYFTDVPTLIEDLKTFFSFQIEHLILKVAGLVQCYTVLC